MANNSSPVVNRITIYDYRGNGVVTTIPINPTAAGSHNFQQDVNKGIGAPAQSFLSDNASAGLSGAEAATGQTVKSYPNLATPFGRASTTLFTVGVNDGSCSSTFSGWPHREGFIETEMLRAIRWWLVAQYYEYVLTLSVVLS